MARKTKFEKLKDKLSELFQMDRADLDFGIYRVMNQKRKEIEKFLEEDLLPQVKESFKEYRSSDKAAIDLSALENEVYTHLYRFFNRYYDKGDFMSLRRYKGDTYAIPYDGEEVKLHWANADQYYIKTTEHFRNYTFQLESGKKVHFQIVDADTEKDNNKNNSSDDRYFLLYEEEPFKEIGDELFIYFEYKPYSTRKHRRTVNEETAAKILEKLTLDDWLVELSKKDPGSDSDRNILEKRFQDYASRNTLDYFIHKDLGGFLRRELDFFIKNEVVNLDDIQHQEVTQVEKYLSKVKVIRKIAQKIIKFLEQLENFQKKLWLKKKFVVETNYCITLDRVSKELYEEIAKNEAQREEWVNLFAIDEMEEGLYGKAYSEPLTVDFLEDNRYLVLDTRFFDQDFKDRLLQDIDDLDEQMDGLLVHSENFQALNLLKERYKEEVKYIYIDPPYNTGPSEILYKNDYKHSSWLSLIEPRISCAKKLLDKKGVFTIAIDDNELYNLQQLLKFRFPNRDISTVVIVHNPRGNISKNFAQTHEYALFLTPQKEPVILRTKEKNKTPRKMRRWGENSKRTDRPTMFYPIYVKDKEIVRIGEVPADDFHPKSKNIVKGEESIEIWPIDQNGIERRWNFGLDSISDNLDRIVVIEKNGELDLFISSEMTVPKTVWSGGDFDAGIYGNSLLKNMFKEKRFSFPKSIHNLTQCLELVIRKDKSATILDFFAGSGTTGHAVININREDKGDRKYLLVEMGEYFDSVLKPRIQKVIYSEAWKDGKPVSRKGSSHMFKYIKLESYEDTLNNLKLERTEKQKQLIYENQDLREDYILNYMLEVESKDSPSLLNLDEFRNPFDYHLKIAGVSVAEPKLTKIDLVETFNYLLGLKVIHIDRIKDYRVVQGWNPKNERVLVIWRDLDEKSNKDLNEFCEKMRYNPRDYEYQAIYVNGDNNLENIRRPDDTWKVKLIEEEFTRLMFDVQDV